MKRIWVFTFEFAGIVKVGGLGEVASNQCRVLSPDPDLEITVFMPNHGVVTSKKDALEITDTGLRFQGRINTDALGLSISSAIVQGTVAKFGGGGITSGIYELGIYEGYYKGVRVLFIRGENEFAKNILNDEIVYNPSTLNGKFALFAMGCRHYCHHLLEKNETELPEIIHTHDHHPLCALLAVRQELNLHERDIRSVMMMHLMTWPRKPLNFIYACGVINQPMEFLLEGNYVRKTVEEMFYLAKGDSTEIPTLEKLACLMCDRVLSVSQTFLNSDVIPNCGGDLIRGKSDFTWNGCDWDHEEMRQSVLQRFPNLTNTMERHEFRKFFLTEALEMMDEEEPILQTEEIQNILQYEYNRPPYYEQGKVKVFEKDGPLMIMSGRLSNQKGLDTLMHAIPGIIEIIPNIRIVLFLIPSTYNVSLMRYVLHEGIKYAENLRVIVGMVRSLFFLAHLSADVYCCPSHWEPFGIIALEAMASRIPVIGTYVGGLQESIIHLENSIEDGTGLLCPPRDAESLKYAVHSLMATMMIAEKVKRGNAQQESEEIKDLLNIIVHKHLKNAVTKNPAFGTELREHCYQRVDSTFRWGIVSQKVKKAYLDLD